MPISASEMNRISKETTATELRKLHKSILENNDALQNAKDSDWTDSDVLTESDTESEEHKVKRLSLAEVFCINQHLQKELRQLSVKYEKTKGSHKLMETKYEQMRINNSEQFLEIASLMEKIKKQTRVIYPMMCTVIACCVHSLWKI